MTLVIAHRGASGYLPEHTLEAYRLAIAQGADFIEPDLVPTRDGVLIARHENELSDSTDVAEHPAFAGRRTRKRIDGIEREGWFAEDFTWAEIRQLRARERLPALRPQSAAHDGRYRIPSFAEVVALARESRRVGVYPETKHPTWFEIEGTQLDGTRIGLDTGALLLDTLLAQDFTDPARVFIQSFEVGNLLRLAREQMPARGLRLPLVQLLGDIGPAAAGALARPWDLAFRAARGGDTDAAYPGLGDAVGRPPAEMTYADLASAAGLRWLAGHVAAVGPWKENLLSSRRLDRPAGSAHPWQRGARLHPLLAQARSLGLGVHPYTLRAEAAFLNREADGRGLSMEEEIALLVAAGATGFFTDQPDRGAAWVAAGTISPAAPPR